MFFESRKVFPQEPALCPVRDPVNKACFPSAAHPSSVHPPLSQPFSSSCSRSAELAWPAWWGESSVLLKQHMVQREETQTGELLVGREEKGLEVVLVTSRSS